MASIYGFTIKGIKQWQGREWLGCQGNIYLNGKKVGWYNDDGNGGSPDIEFNGTKEEREKVETEFKQAWVRYYKKYPMQGQFADLEPSADIFMGEILELIEAEKIFKVVLKQGKKVLAYYTDIASNKDYMANFKTIEAYEKFKADYKEKISDLKAYKSLEDFDIK